MTTAIDRLIAAQAYFKDHVLTIEQDTEELKVYLFRNPNSSNLWQRWILSSGSVIVLGDAGDSIYRGGAFANLHQIANSNLSYFSSKCVADEDGVNQSKFDHKTATDCIHNLIVENHRDLVEFEEGMELIDKIEVLEEKLQEKDCTIEIPRSFDDEHEMVIWLRNNDEVIGYDWWDGFNSSRKTNVPFWHLAAIKEAVKQLPN